MKNKYKSPKLSTQDITDALFIRFHHHTYQISNAYIFNWESDFFSLSEAEYIYEIEVKVDRRDYKDDFNKVDKHVLLESKNSINYSQIPNKFFYAFPKNMIATIEIPSYAGLIEVDPYTKEVNITKDAPFLHQEKIFPLFKDSLLDKFYHRYKDSRISEYSLKLKINELEEKIKEFGNSQKLL